MALRAYDTVLIIRAQNMASNVLRGVANDLRKMGAATPRGRVQQLTAARQAQIQKIGKLETQQAAQLATMRSRIDSRTAAAQEKLNLAQADQAKLQRAITDAANAHATQLVRMQATQKSAQASQLAAERQLAAAEKQRTRARQGPGGKFVAQAKMDEAQLKKVASANKLVEERQLRLAAAEQRTVATTQALTNAGQRHASMMQNAATQQGVLTTRTARASAVLQGSKAAYAELNAVEARNREILAAEVGQLKALEGELVRAQKAQRDFTVGQRWTKVSQAGNILRDVGRGARLMGLGLTAGVGVAAYQFAQLNTKAALVATQMGGVNESFKQTKRQAEQMQNAIMLTMRDSASSMQDVSASAYDLFSSLSSAHKGFLSAADGAKLLKLMSTAAIAGQANLADVTKGVVYVMNAFGISAKDMPRVMNRLFASVRFGRQTFGEFASTLPTIAPAAKAANQSLDTMAGTMAFLTRRLGPAKAAVGYARILELFGRADVVAGLKKMNVQITDTAGHLIPLPDIISKVAKRFPELTKGGTNTLNFFKMISAIGSGGAGTMGTIQARRAFAFLITQTGEYRKMNRDVIKDNKEFTKSAKLLNESLGVRLQKTINRVKTDFMRLGKDALPIFEKLIGLGERVLSWWEKLPAATRKQYTEWAAYVGIGAIVVGTLASIAGGLLNLVGIFGKFSKLGFFQTAFLAIWVAKLIAGKNALEGIHSIIGKIGDAIHKFFDFSTGSLQNFIVGMTGAMLVGRKMFGGGRGAGMDAMTLIPFGPSIGQVKQWGRTVKSTLSDVKSAYKTGETASSLDRVLQGAGDVGLLAGGMGGKAKGIEGAAIEGEKLVRTTSRFKGLMSAASVAAEALPGWFKLTAVAIGGLAAGMYLWDRWNSREEEHAKKIRNWYLAIAKIVSKPLAQAKLFGDLPNALANLKTAQLDLGDLNAQIQTLEKQLANRKLKGADRAQAERDLNRLLIQRWNLTDQIYKLQVKANNEFAAANQSVKGQIGNFRTIGTMDKARHRILTEIGKLMKQHWAFAKGVATGTIKDTYAAEQADAARAKRIGELHQRLKDVTGAEKIAIAGSKAGMVQLNRSIGTLLRSMVSIDPQHFARILTPQNLPRMTKLLQRAVLRHGGMLTRDQLVLFIKLATHPAELKKVHGDIANLVRTSEADLKRMNEKAAQDLRKRAEAHILGLQVLRNSLLSAAEQPGISPKEAAKLRTAAGKIKIPSLKIAIEEEKASERRAKRNVTNFFGKPIKYKVETVTPAQNVLIQEGYNIVEGLRLGIVAHGPLAISEIVKVSKTMVKATKQVNKSGSPSKVYEAMGKDNMVGLANGIKNNRKLAVDATTQTAKDSIKGATQALGNGQGSLEAAYNALSGGSGSGKKGHKKGRKKHPLHLVEDFKDEMIELGQVARKSQLVFASISRKTLEASITSHHLNKYRSMFEGLYLKHVPLKLLYELSTLGSQGVNIAAKLSGMSSKYLRAYIKAWESGTTDLSTIRKGDSKQMQQWQKDVTDSLSTVKSSTTDLLSQIQSTFDQFKQQNQTAMGDLFTGPGFKGPFYQSMIDLKTSYGGRLSSRDLLNDLKQQVQGFSRWRGELNQLAKKGVPPELIQELETIGPSSQPELDALVRMKPAELRRYVALYKRRTQLINVASKQDMSNQLKIWRSFGRNIAAAITQGIQDESPALMKYLEKLVKQIMTGEKNKTTHHHPPKTKGQHDEGRTVQVHHTHNYSPQINMGGGMMSENQLNHVLRRGYFNMRNRRT